MPRVFAMQEDHALVELSSAPDGRRVVVSVQVVCPGKHSLASPCASLKNRFSNGAIIGGAVGERAPSHNPLSGVWSAYAGISGSNATAVVYGSDAPW